MSFGGQMLIKRTGSPQALSLIGKLSRAIAYRLLSESRIEEAVGALNTMKVAL